MSELARQPQPRFEHGNFTPPKREAEGKTQPELPKTPDNLPRRQSTYVILRDAWGDEVFIPLVEMTHTWGMSSGETSYAASVVGVTQTSDASDYTHRYARERIGRFEVDDEETPGIISPIGGHPYLP